VETHETLHPDSLVHQPTDTAQRQSDVRRPAGAHDQRQVKLAKTRTNFALRWFKVQTHPTTNMLPITQRFASSVSDAHWTSQCRRVTTALAPISELNRTVRSAH
jgi:hypothetical protein